MKYKVGDRVVIRKIQLAGGITIMKIQWEDYFLTATCINFVEKFVQ